MVQFYSGTLKTCSCCYLENMFLKWSDHDYQRIWLDCRKPLDIYQGVSVVVFLIKIM